MLSGPLQDDFLEAAFLYFLKNQHFFSHILHLRGLLLYDILTFKNSPVRLARRYIEPLLRIYPAFLRPRGKAFLLRGAMAKELLNKKDIERIISRIAHEIIEKNKGPENVCLVGIQRGGVHLAQRIAEKIKLIENAAVPVGALDI